MRGFTLMEMIIVLAVIALMTAAITPFYRTFYLGQQLDSTTDELVSNLRRAQTKAIISEEDARWGIRWGTGVYIIFNENDPSLDEEVDYPDNITIQAPGDIIFDQLTGTTSTTGEITLNQTEIINLNAQGRINKQ